MRRDGWVKLENGEIRKKRYCVDPKWMGFLRSEPELWSDYDKCHGVFYGQGSGGFC